MFHRICKANEFYGCDKSGLSNRSLRKAIQNRSENYIIEYEQRDKNQWYLNAGFDGIIETLPFSQERQSLDK